MHWLRGARSTNAKEFETAPRTGLCMVLWKQMVRGRVRVGSSQQQLQLARWCSSSLGSPRLAWAASRPKAQRLKAEDRASWRVEARNSEKGKTRHHRVHRVVSAQYSDHSSTSSGPETRSAPDHDSDSLDHRRDPQRSACSPHTEDILHNDAHERTMSAEASRISAPAFKLREDELPPELILSIERILDLHGQADTDPLERLTNDFNSISVLNDYFPDGVCTRPSHRQAAVTHSVPQRPRSDS